MALKIRFIFHFSTIFFGKIILLTKSKVSSVLWVHNLIYSVGKVSEGVTKLLFDMIGKMVDIKVASLKELDLKIELIENLLLFSGIEASKGFEKWAFCEFGIGRVLGPSAIRKRDRVLSEEFASRWSLVDCGRLVSHEKVTFVGGVFAVFHPIRV